MSTTGYAFFLFLLFIVSAGLSILSHLAIASSKKYQELYLQEAKSHLKTLNELKSCYEDRREEQKREMEYLKLLDTLISRVPPPIHRGGRGGIYLL